MEYGSSLTSRFGVKSTTAFAFESPSPALISLLKVSPASLRIPDLVSHLWP
jgi:hypothetical protein